MAATEYLLDTVVKIISHAQDMVSVQCIARHLHEANNITSTTSSPSTANFKTRVYKDLIVKKPSNMHI